MFCCVSSAAHVAAPCRWQTALALSNGRHTFHLSLLWFAVTSYVKQWYAKTASLFAGGELFLSLPNLGSCPYQSPFMTSNLKRIVNKKCQGHSVGKVSLSDKCHRDMCIFLWGRASSLTSSSQDLYCWKWLTQLAGAVHTFNPSIREAEAGGSPQPGLQSVPVLG